MSIFPSRTRRYEDFAHQPNIRIVPPAQPWTKPEPIELAGHTYTLDGFRVRLSEAFDGPGMEE